LGLFHARTAQFDQALEEQVRRLAEQVDDLRRRLDDPGRRSEG